MFCHMNLFFKCVICQDCIGLVRPINISYSFYCQAAATRQLKVGKKLLSVREFTILFFDIPLC